jgi:hypothetical protein
MADWRIEDEMRRDVECDVVVLERFHESMNISHRTATVISVSDISIISTTMSPRLVASAATSHFFKSATWTPDGSTLLTNSNDNILRTYVL